MTLREHALQTKTRFGRHSMMDRVASALSAQQQSRLNIPQHTALCFHLVRAAQAEEAIFADSVLARAWTRGVLVVGAKDSTRESLCFGTRMHWPGARVPALPRLYTALRRSMPPL